MPEGRTPPLPGRFDWSAAADWQAIEFISDLHLGDDHPATFERWARYMRSTTADAVLILGDLFEVWIGDDACMPGTFAAAVTDVTAGTSACRTVGFMAGNRDFLVGHGWLQRCGMMPLPDPTVLDAWGRRVLLTHGDALCIDDLPYQRFRAEVRSAAWQQRFLAQPLVDRERQARAMRDASESQKRQRGAQGYADVDRAAATAWLAATDCEDLVHGHTHRPGTENWGTAARRHVLADWEFDAAPVRGQVLRLTRQGFERIDLEP